MLLLFSCASYKKFDYAAIDSVKSLEGIYQNEGRAISGGLNANDHSQGLWFKENDIFKLEFPDSKTLNLSYLSNTGWKSLKSYKGKYNRKKNTFDIWHSRYIIPLVIITSYNFDKTRIGKDSDGNLVVNHADNHGGWVVPLGAAGNNYSYIKKVSLIKEFPPLPYTRNNKWGYTDMDGNELIEARFDSVVFFEGDIARVTHNGKWGVIDREGKEVIPVKYKKIDPIGFFPYTFVYSDDNKVGIVLRNGIETIKPIYEKIVFFGNKDFAITYLNGYRGIISAEKTLFPPVFDDVHNKEYLSKSLKNKNLSLVGWVTIRDNVYAIDKNGYLYPYTTNIWGNADVDLNAKIHYTQLLGDRLYGK